MGLENLGKLSATVLLIPGLLELVGDPAGMGVINVGGFRNNVVPVSHGFGNNATEECVYKPSGLEKTLVLC